MVLRRLGVYKRQEPIGGKDCVVLLDDLEHMLKGDVEDSEERLKHLETIIIAITDTSLNSQISALLEANDLTLPVAVLPGCQTTQMTVLKNLMSAKCTTAFCLCKITKHLNNINH